MSIQAVAVIILIGLPIAIGFISGLMEINGSTVHPTGWTYVKEYQEPVAPVFEVREQQQQSDYVPVMELDNVPVAASQQHMDEYVSSRPSADMDSAIEDLLKSIPANSLQGNESPASDYTHADAYDLALSELAGTELTMEDLEIPDEMLQIDEPKLQQAINLQELHEEAPTNVIKPEVEPETSDEFVTDDVYIPSPLPPNHYRSILSRYGTVVAEQISTTPGYGGTGKSDIMIGRLQLVANELVLAYDESFVHLKGIVPKDKVNDTLLVKGQFISQEQFFVTHWEDPELIGHSVPFQDVHAELAAAVH